MDLFRNKYSREFLKRDYFKVLYTLRIPDESLGPTCYWEFLVGVCTGPGEVLHDGVATTHTTRVVDREGCHADPQTGVHPAIERPFTRSFLPSLCKTRFSKFNKNFIFSLCLSNVFSSSLCVPLSRSPRFIGCSF